MVMGWSSFAVTRAPFGVTLLPWTVTSTTVPWAGELPAPVLSPPQPATRRVGRTAARVASVDRVLRMRGVPSCSVVEGGPASRQRGPVGVRDECADEGAAARRAELRR